MQCCSCNTQPCHSWLALVQIYLKDSWTGRGLLALAGLWVQHNIQVYNSGTDLGGAVILGLFYYFQLEWHPTNSQKTHFKFCSFLFTAYDEYLSCPTFQFCPATISIFAVHQTSSWCFTYKSGVCLKTKVLSPDTNTRLHSLEMYVSGGSLS